MGETAPVPMPTVSAGMMAVAANVRVSLKAPPAARVYLFRDASDVAEPSDAAGMRAHLVADSARIVTNATAGDRWAVRLVCPGQRRARMRTVDVGVRDTTVTLACR